MTFHMDANETGKNRKGKIGVSLTQNAAKKKIFTVNESKEFSNIYRSNQIQRSGQGQDGPAFVVHDCKR